MSATTKVIEPVAPEAIHKPFTWLHRQVEHDQHAQFYALTMDICQGVRTCLELVQSVGMDRENGTPPLLDVEDTARLLRLAIVSAKLLGESAQERIECAEGLAAAQAVKEGK